MARKIGPSWLVELQVLGRRYEYDEEIWEVDEDDMKQARIGTLDEEEVVIVPATSIRSNWLVIHQDGEQEVKPIPNEVSNKFRSLKLEHS